MICNRVGAGSGGGTLGLEVHCLVDELFYVGDASEGVLDWGDELCVAAGEVGRRDAEEGEAGEGNAEDGGGESAERHTAGVSGAGPVKAFAGLELGLGAKLGVARVHSSLLVLVYASWQAGFRQPIVCLRKVILN